MLLNECTIKWNWNIKTFQRIWEKTFYTIFRQNSAHSQHKKTSNEAQVVDESVKNATNNVASKGDDSDKIEMTNGQQNGGDDDNDVEDEHVEKKGIDINVTKGIISYK